MGWAQVRGRRARVLRPGLLGADRAALFALPGKVCHLRSDAEQFQKSISRIAGAKHAQSGDSRTRSI